MLNDIGMTVRMFWVTHVIVVACPYPLCCCIYTALVSLLFGTVIPTLFNTLYIYLTTFEYILLVVNRYLTCMKMAIHNMSPYNCNYWLFSHTVDILWISNCLLSPVFRPGDFAQYMNTIVPYTTHMHVQCHSDWIPPLAIIWCGRYPFIYRYCCILPH